MSTRVSMGPDFGEMQRRLQKSNKGRLPLESMGAGVRSLKRGSRWLPALPAQYMPGAGAAGAGSGAGMSVTMDSVVSTMAATEEAFCRAERVTLVGSMMPR